MSRPRFACCCRRYCKVAERFADAAGRLAGLCGVLVGWTPQVFWTATPAELACVLRALAPQGESPPTSCDLERLKEQFPDG